MSAHPCRGWIAVAYKTHPTAYHRFFEPSHPVASSSKAKGKGKAKEEEQPCLDALPTLVPVRKVQIELLKWFNGVKEDRAMPWRKDVDPRALSRAERNQRGYEVWVSEIMLQQTQVETVKSYWTRWMQTFPTVQDLAKATEEQVHKAWAGLGYYSRSTRLLKGAQTVVNDFDGIIPTEAEDLLKVDGIGPYSAGAISSIAFGKRSAMVDGNVQRVLSRLCAIHANPTAKATTNLIWSIADTLVPPLDFRDEEERMGGKKHLNPPGAFNQALMELGATVCTPTNPSCSKCPLSESCLALAEVRFRKHKVPTIAKTATIEEECSVCEPRDAIAGEVTIFPMKKEKKKARQEDTLTAIVEFVAGPTANDRQVLIVKRPSKGLLAGLYEFPSVDWETVDADMKDYGDVLEDESTRRKFLRRYLRSLVPSLKEYDLETRTISSVLHLYSHQHRTYHVTLYTLKPRTTTDNTDAKLPQLDSDSNAKWVSSERMADVNLGGAMLRAWELRNGRQDPNGSSGKSKSNAKKSAAAAGGNKKRKAAAGVIEENDIRSFFSKPVVKVADESVKEDVKESPKKKKRVIVLRSDEEEE